MTIDIAESLTSRRARITPGQAGLPTYGKRRVPGLRREEVASLARVSIEYRRRLERGSTGTKRIHHPVVGDPDLRYEAMELSADSGLTMSVYAAEPDSASQQDLDLLVSWTATPDPANTAEVGDQATSR